MNLFNRIRTRICIILAVIILATSFSFMPVETQAASTSVLFVGNSLTFYNNIPEMFQKMAAAGGTSVNVYAAVYAKRSLAEHANAIAAVIKTKGQASNLTKAQKKYFTYVNSTEYDENVYYNYARIFWDYNRNKARHYDTIVLQTYYNYGRGDASATSVYNSLSTIINARNDSKTNYVINVTSGVNSSTTYNLASAQKKIDNIADTAISYVNSSAKLRKKFRYIWAAYTGRAFCNYLFYTGTRTAIAREPGAYEVLYNYGNQVGYLNDLYCADCTHYTILGSYLAAAVLYSSIIGSAQNTAYYYKGGSIDCLYTLYNGRCQQFSQFYNNGQGFTDPTIPWQITYIADATTYYGMRLTSTTSATNWKNKKNVPQYDYMCHKVTVTFDGNGADINNFKKQTYYYYSANTNYFSGTIEREGYKMVGWALTKNAKTAKYKINSNVSNSWIETIYKKYNGKVTLYAVWEKLEEEPEPETEPETAEPETITAEEETTTGEETTMAGDETTSGNEESVDPGQPDEQPDDSGNNVPDYSEPEAQEPEAQDPDVQEPVVIDPAITEPLVQEPVVQEPAATEPAVQEPQVTEPEAYAGPAEPEVSHEEEIAG